MKHLIRLVTPGWYLGPHKSTLYELTKHKYLLWEMSKLELRDRYVGQALGSFWAVFTPLLTIFVYLFIFAFVFKTKMPASAVATGGGWGDSYTLYLLSGLIPWMGVQDIMSRSTTIILSNASLVKQVLFPLEVLPLKIFFSAAINEGIALLLFLAYGLLAYGLPGFGILLLPFALALQVLACAGIAFIFSAIGAYLRDLKDIVGVLTFVLIYTMPIFYAPGMIPAKLSFFLQLNPLTHMVLVFHDALYFGRILSPWSWIIFAAFSITLWLIGCRIFSATKNMFGNVL